MFKNTDDQSQIVTMQEVIDHHDSMMSKTQTTDFPPSEKQDFVPAEEEELQDEGEQNGTNKVNE